MNEGFANASPLTEDQLQSGIEATLREITRLREEIQEDRARGERLRARRQATMSEVRAILTELQRAA